MSEPSAINSPTNERIKRLVRLRSRRHRDQEGVFIVEGRELDRAVVAGNRVLEVYGPESSPAYGADSKFVVSGPALAKASYRSDPAAVIGVLPQFGHNLDSLQLPEEPLILVAESLEKPGNLGAIIRTAEAVGASLVLCPDGFDVFNPNVIRASTGAVFAVPVIPITPVRATSWLRSRGLRIVAGDPAGDIPIWEADMTGPLAIVVGDEHSGLTSHMKSEADQLVAIPLHGAIVDSLNSSVSVAILAYEALRQRSARS